MANPVELDARGLLCPLPVLRLQKALRDLPPGAEVHLLATDAVAAVDVPHFCTEAGHGFLGQSDMPDGATRYRVQRGP